MCSEQIREAQKSSRGIQYRQHQCCFQKRPFHQLFGCSIRSGNSFGGISLVVFSATGTAGAAATGSVAVDCVDTAAGKGMAAAALAAIFLPIPPESRACVCGQNLQDAKAVAVPIENRMIVPATRISLRSLFASFCHASLSFFVIASCLASLRLVRSKALCIRCVCRA